MRWSFALVVLAACHSRAAPIVAETDAGNPHETGACAPIVALHVVVDAGVDTHLRQASAAVQTCLPTKSGAWGAAQEPRAPALYLDDAFDMHFVHAAGTTLVNGPHETWKNIARLSIFDFDGDGEAELVAEGSAGCTIDVDLTCQRPTPRVEVLTFKNGNVGSYPQLVVPTSFVQSHVVLTADNGKRDFDRSDKTIRFFDTIDVDHDGRPDLQTHLFYEVAATDGDVAVYAIHGPTFIAHSLADGHFSLDDAVSKNALAAECTSQTDLDKANGETLFAIAVCARLAGMSVAEVGQRYAARCTPIMAKNKLLLDRMKKGEVISDTGIDWFAEGACRTEPEGGWSTTEGMPVSITKMLQETQPVLATHP